MNTIDVESLGYKNGDFSIWSPLAKSVCILLYKSFIDVKNNKITMEIPLTQKENGIWKSTGISNQINSCKYYKIRFIFNNAQYEVCDIWNKCASPDSIASQLTDINTEAECFPKGFTKKYFNPFGNTGKDSKKYTDAVIFEMHIRDWSRSVVQDSTGKFLDIADNQQLINHLKELGVTHVQILPMFDYKNTNDDKAYNWGYDPYNYNVPEGRYVTEGYEDGSQAVFEMRAMIQKFHENGIAVNMDVVFNHTKGTGPESLYDQTYPGYFYRKTEDGEYSNGSGCGNELATNHNEVKQFVINSLKNWMKSYHINGFRFDLMGLHEVETMKEIYEELKKIDPNVMIYGEPWTGGLSTVQNGCNKESIDECCIESNLNGVACFNDNFRNAVKGGEFGGFEQGHVQGNYKDEGVCTGLIGSLKDKGGFTVNPCRTINYVECHDNYTLFDKLAISFLNKTSFSGDLYNAIGNDGVETVKSWNKLCAAYVILAQGVPFINGGQEFMRTKKGDENSYISDDSVNQISFEYKNQNIDVFNVYKGLIRLRKENPEAFGCNYNAKAQTLVCGVTLYETGKFIIYFNASKYEYKISLKDYSALINIDYGTVEKLPFSNEDNLVSDYEVPSCSFRIFLKK